MNQWHLFLAFFRVGMLGYGGGPSSIPLVRAEVVTKYRWMTDEEFAEILAIANALPGPIATKLAGYIGHRVGGPLGLLNAVLATTAPTVVLMIVLLAALSSFKDTPWVAGMTKAVLPVVAVMLAEMTWQFAKQARAALGWRPAALLLLACFLALQWLGLHPALVVAVLLAAAFVGRSKPKAVDRDKGGERRASS
ncbi:chromate transporter [Geobacillus sp. PK12]|uniref:chromate transporter n=1 Tax=Geobacillus sp. PK12 TaxID=2508525 RepID=UPI001010D65B|nr:chromate transporter [Geobacillus sp. PK12]RXS87322.1 chromate transporter [Geobacillus sp. PK12]